ncbi:Putative glucan endo-1,3-beta-glucosidase GVI (Fragment) [Linum perenne]
MEVVLGTLNSDLEQLATNPSFAAHWVSSNVVPYHRALRFRHVAAGNEVIPGPFAQHVLGAMRNLDCALKSAGVAGVHVSTALSFASIVRFLAENDYPLLVNVYPYFAYKSDCAHIDLDYALGNRGGSFFVADGRLRYRSLFDAMVDTMYAAAEKVGGKKVRMVVTETGWPSAGDAVATVANAKAYVNNAAAKAGSGAGTPRRPRIGTETYLFALFNEDLKPEGEERNFGLYWPDFTEVYHVDFPQ